MSTEAVENTDKKVKEGISLRSSKIFWDRSNPLLDDILDRGHPDHEDGLVIKALHPSELELLIKELDRRLVQYADKVAFEAENDLADYTPISERNK